MGADLLDPHRQENHLAESVDSVNISADSTEENSNWNRKIFISSRRKQWSIRCTHKEIVKFVFNKLTQETKTRLSMLIIHWKETLGKEQSPKMGFKKILYIKYQRMVYIYIYILVCRWVAALLHASQSLFFIHSFSFGGGKYCRYLHVCNFCSIKLYIFDKHKEKYAKPNIVMFISLEMNYFVGTGCFCLLEI